MGRQLKVFLPIQKDISFSGIIIILLGTFCESKECAAQKRIHFFILEVLSFELTYFNSSFIKFVFLLVYGKPLNSPSKRAVLTQRYYFSFFHSGKKPNLYFFLEGKGGARTFFVLFYSLSAEPRFWIFFTPD